MSRFATDAVDAAAVPTQALAQLEHAALLVPWASLPDELVAHVCELLPAGDVARLGGVCRDWAASATSEAVWRDRLAGVRALTTSVAWESTLAVGTRHAETGLSACDQFAVWARAAQRAEASAGRALARWQQRYERETPCRRRQVWRAQHAVLGLGWLAVATVLTALFCLVTAALGVVGGWRRGPLALLAALLALGAGLARAARQSWPEYTDALRLSGSLGLGVVVLGPLATAARSPPGWLLGPGLGLGVGRGSTGVLGPSAALVAAATLSSLFAALGLATPLLAAPLLLVGLALWGRLASEVARWTLVRVCHFGVALAALLATLLVWPLSASGLVAEVPLVVLLVPLLLVCARLGMALLPVVEDELCRWLLAGSLAVTLLAIAAAASFAVWPRWALALLACGPGSALALWLALRACCLHHRSIRWIAQLFDAASVAEAQTGAQAHDRAAYARLFRSTLCSL